MAARNTFFIQTQGIGPPLGHSYLLWVSSSSRGPRPPSPKIPMISIISLSGRCNAEDQSEYTGVEPFLAKGTHFQEVFSTTIPPYSMQDVPEWNAPLVERAARSAERTSSVSISRRSWTSGHGVRSIDRTEPCFITNGLPGVSSPIWIWRESVVYHQGEKSRRTYRCRATEETKRRVFCGFSA